ncbi:reticulon-1-A-like [Rhopilema esculentum]|uniref:reticulon-1-A-like n=1 Tax=Rhopilema esculentum TaxID=499914 RepID=UPI0031D3A19D|eukprot:gene3008-1269_t
MSEIEDAIIVDKMDEMEAEHFEKGSTDLLDFGDTPVHEQEETPVSSTTDQLMDLMKPDTTYAEVAENKEDLPATIGQENVQEIFEPETVTSTAADVDHENQEEQKPKSNEVTQKSELTSCMAKCLISNNVDRRVIDLIYWKCWKKTAAVFGGILFILMSLMCCTLLSVASLFSMAILAAAFLYRIGMTVFNAVQKTNAEHPFKHMLEEDLELSEESVQKWASELRQCVNTKVKKLQKLFLIEDVVESVKFGVILWILSYIGSWFSMLTISIIACVKIFTLPVLYERHQEQVDSVLSTVKGKAKEVMSIIQSKLPEKLKFGKAKEE